MAIVVDYYVWRARCGCGLDKLYDSPETAGRRTNEHIRNSPQAACADATVTDVPVYEDDGSQ